LTKRQSNEGSNPCNERTRERIRAVKRHMAMEGLYGGGKPPFGFDVVEDKVGAFYSLTFLAISLSRTTGSMRNSFAAWAAGAN
jgi:hypothetical protein